ncbi:short-chain dehydrogenase [Xylariaceae sp. AK1471]|nr:short-chain dehydrogenase [Xylariaceae sp. AK1471]
MSGRNMRFKCALVTEGESGIGRALSEYLISKGKKVLIAGHTQSKLHMTAKAIGAAGYYVLDTESIPEIPAFIKMVISEHPDLDCLINNSGVQRPLQVLGQDADNFLTKADQEIDVNIRVPMHLTVGLLPHLKAKPLAVIMNVSSVLGFVPFSIFNPVYNGTKAWLHFWSMNLRSQLKHTNVWVVEIAPPTIATDLHRDNRDDIKKDKKSNALPLRQFIKEVSEKLEKGEETIGAGMGDEIVNKWYGTFGDMYKD